MNKTTSNTSEDTKYINHCHCSQCVTLREKEKKAKKKSKGDKNG